MKLELRRPMGPPEDSVVMRIVVACAVELSIAAVVVEGAVPAVVAHEIGHASGHAAHDANETVMKPTGAFNVPNSSKVSAAVCAAARTGAALSKTSGSDDCCMFPK